MRNDTGDTKSAIEPSRRPNLRTITDRRSFSRFHACRLLWSESTLWKLAEILGTYTDAEDLDSLKDTLYSPNGEGRANNRFSATWTSRRKRKGSRRNSGRNGTVESPFFKRWFGKSKAVDEQ